MNRRIQKINRIMIEIKKINMKEMWRNRKMIIQIKYQSQKVKSIIKRIKYQNNKIN